MVGGLVGWLESRGGKGGCVVGGRGRGVVGEGGGCCPI